MTNEPDTLLTALYVKVDDELEAERWMGRPPQLSDAELVTLAVAQALLGFRSEARWLRYARKNLAVMFPYLPQQSGYNKRLKAALPLVKKAIRMLAVDTDFWFDNHWIADSTPVGVWAFATYGEAVGNGRLGRIRVLRLALEVLLGPAPVSGLYPDRVSPPRSSRWTSRCEGSTCCGPPSSGRRGARESPSSSPLTESAKDTLKGQLDLEQHGGRTFEGVAVRVAQRNPRLGRRDLA